MEVPSADVEWVPPVVDWAPFDLVQSYCAKNNQNSPPLPALNYHVMSAGYDVLAPVGALLGGALHVTGAWRPLPSAMAVMGSSALVAGGVGALLGLQKKSQIIKMLNNKQQQQSLYAKVPIPWNDEGIQQRVDALSQNFVVRVLDLSVWSGMGLAAGILCIKGGPSALGLNSGSLGTLQALGLGSAVGSVSALACIYANRQQEKKG